MNCHHFIVTAFQTFRRYLLKYVCVVEPSSCPKMEFTLHSLMACYIYANMHHGTSSSKTLRPKPKYWFMSGTPFDITVKCACGLKEVTLANSCEEQHQTVSPHHAI
jgi:hypothetical protein